MHYLLDCKHKCLVTAQPPELDVASQAGKLSL